MRCSFCRATALVILTLSAYCATAVAAEGPAESQKPSPRAARGPLRVCPANPRYFADGAGKAIYLTGAHTWNNFKDEGPTDPPLAFDFPAYLDFLERYHHNFIRLWTWDLTTSCSEPPVEGQQKLSYARPFPWRRTGPGNALDGKPKFDLTALEPSYFERLRTRVKAAGERGIYVSVMLFEGWGLHSCLPPWRWDGHPFHAANNINGINGDPNGDGYGIETHTLQVPTITALQEAYIRKVLDTLGDLDNVLYEIANESGVYSTQWQYHMVRFIHDYERSQPKQHPVGMTFQWCKIEGQVGTNRTLFESPADWISPNPEGGYKDDPPAADGRKVILSDTDHLWGEGGDQAWVWKTFLRGGNPIWMDPYKPDQKSVPKDVRERVLRNMGYALRYAERVDLAAMTPHSELASSKYCLAAPGKEYLVYLPDGGEVTVDLSAASGELAAEWLRPSDGTVAKGGTLRGGAKVALKAPFDGEAVLYLQAK